METLELELGTGTSLDFAFLVSDSEDSTVINNWLLTIRKATWYEILEDLGFLLVVRFSWTKSGV